MWSRQPRLKTNLYASQTMKYGRQPIRGYSVKRRPTRNLVGVTQTNILIECRKCGRVGREADANAAGWRHWLDGIDLYLICALCAYREFRPDVPALTDA
jgi:hypothetical protein